MTATGLIRGVDSVERAVNLAGWLAEEGVAGLCVLESDGGWTLLTPRRTDLPAELLRRVESGPVELAATDRPLRVVFTPVDCVWMGSVEVPGSAPPRSADSDA